MQVKFVANVKAMKDWSHALDEKTEEPGFAKPSTTSEPRVATKRAMSYGMNDAEQQHTHAPKIDNARRN